MTLPRRRVTIPHVASVRRAVAAACTPGDAATVGMQPDLLRLLDGIAGDLAQPPGCGFQPRYSVPIGLIVFATETVLEPLKRPDIGWATRSFALHWRSLPRAGDALRASATVRQVSALDAWLDVEVRAEDTLIAHGELRAVPTSSGRFAPAGIGAGRAAGAFVVPPSASRPPGSDADAAQRAADDPMPDLPETLFDLRPAAIVDRAGGIRVIVYPDLPRLLLRPLAGYAEPLGRRTHPIGGFATSAAVTAAQALLMRRRGMDGAAPMPALFAFTLRGEVTLDERLFADAVPGREADRVDVRIIRPDARVAATAVLGFRAAQNHG